MAGCLFAFGLATLTCDVCGFSAGLAPRAVRLPPGINAATSLPTVSRPAVRVLQPQPRVSAEGAEWIPRRVTAAPKAQSGYRAGPEGRKHGVNTVPGALARGFESC